MKSKPFIVVGAIAVIGAVAAVFIIALNLVSQQGARPVPGSPAPDFPITLYDEYQAGLPKDIKLSDLRGKVVVMNFWASWCVECRKEADALEAIHQKYKDRGVVLLGVDYLDTEAPAMDYLKEFGITYANGLDVQQKIAKSYRITGVPETFYIDEQGIVREVVIQPINEQQMIATIDKLLAD